MSKNVSALADNEGSTPDWIEFYNADTSEIQLNGFLLTDNLKNGEPWLFPEVVIKAKSFMLVNASSSDSDLFPRYWETVINWGDTWKYSIGNSGIPAEWKDENFNEAGWHEGPTGIGVGDNDDRTVVVNSNSIFARKKFFIEDIEQIVQAVFHMDYDDGFAAYINGIEIARVNLGNPGQDIPYNYFATNQHEALIYQGGKPEAFYIDNIHAIVHNGMNVLAVQVHNYSESSSDLSCIPFLSLGYKSKPTNSYGGAEILDLPDFKLNANFSLSSSGDVIYLMNPNGSHIDSLVVPPLMPDISYGRKPDGSDTLVYFKESTPGSSNETNGYANVISSVNFINPSGFYNNQVAIALNNVDPLVKIYFTLNGDTPTSNSTKYDGPFVISKTTVIRAIAIREGFLPSQVSSATYFINEVHNLPVVSIVTDRINLWDNKEGIYVKGPNAESAFPYFNANFWQDWEKEVFIQFFESDKSLSFESNAGIKIFGGWSRGHSQKSLAVYARKKYGASSFQHTIFPSRPFKEYTSFLLRNSGNDWGYTMIRDGFMQTLVGNQDLDLQAYRPAILFINGEYWGIQNLREKINEDFIAAHNNADPDKLDILELDGVVIEGNNTHYKEMISFINKYDMSVDANYQVVTGKMDINNFIAYMTAQIYYDNKDWPGNNIKFWRPQSNEGKWRWLIFDTDFGYGIYDPMAYKFNTLSFALAGNGPGWPNPPWSTFLLRSLLKNNQFKNLFLNKFADLCNTILLPDSAVSLIDSLSAQISGEIQRHGQRWNTFSKTGWTNNLGIMKNFARQRLLYLKAYYLLQFQINGFVDVKININDVTGGSVKINSIIENDSSWEGQYFYGNTISLTAIPKYGYKFIGWQGESESIDRSITFEPNGDVQFTALFQKDNSLPNVVINEINYNSSPQFDTEDWIELYNNSKKEVDLHGWIIRDSDDAHKFSFPPGFILQGEAYIVIARDSTAFRKYLTEDIDILGNLPFALNNSGDEVRLFDNNNTLIDSVSYDDEDPWPIECDGTGKTLSLINADMENSRASSWKSSIGLGTPGKINDVFITEITLGNQAITTFRLKQNYPNPFNPVTIIEYTIPSSLNSTSILNEGNDTNSSTDNVGFQNDLVKVQLDIYDILGRVVTTLVNENQNSGNYTIEFDGRNLTSGIYFYNLRAGSFNQTRKMILLR